MACAVIAGAGHPGELGDLLAGFDGIGGLRRILLRAMLIGSLDHVRLRPLLDRLLQPQGQAGALVWTEVPPAELIAVIPALSLAVDA